MICLKTRRFVHQNSAFSVPPPQAKTENLHPAYFARNASGMTSEIVSQSGLSFSRELRPELPPNRFGFDPAR